MSRVDSSDRNSHQTGSPEHGKSCGKVWKEHRFLSSDDLERRDVDL